MSSLSPLDAGGRRRSPATLLNLIPFEYQERRDGPRLRTDGRLAPDAIRVARALR